MALAVDGFIQGFRYKGLGVRLVRCEPQGPASGTLVVPREGQRETPRAGFLFLSLLPGCVGGWESAKRAATRRSITTNAAVSLWTTVTVVFS